MNPTIGRVVVYKPTEIENANIKGRGNSPQKENAAIIVAVDKKTVNLQVLCDGADTFYVKDIEEGEKAGQWSWPVIKKDGE